MKQNFLLRHGIRIAGLSALASVFLFTVVAVLSFQSDKRLIDQWESYMSAEEELFRLREDANRLYEIEHRLGVGGVHLDRELRAAGTELTRIPSLEGATRRRIAILKEAREHLLAGRDGQANRILRGRELDQVSRDLREALFEYEMNERSRLQDKLSDRLFQQERILEFDIAAILLAVTLLISASIMILFYIQRLRKFDRDTISARVEAERASRMKSSFLANMSHEIRTPLNGVVGLTRLLRETRLNEDQEEIVESLEASGRTLLALVNDILDLSKIESGKIEIVKEPYDVTSMLQDLEKAFRTQAEKKKLALVFEGPSVPIAVRGDSLKVRQVLQNLISNAIKFTREGEVRVRWRKEGARMRFEVKDTGIGIPDEALDRIFRPFEQADSSTSRTHGGSGLGLAICRNLVIAMGGEMAVQSQAGLGSLFWFELPFEPATLVRTTGPSEAAEERAPALTSVVPGQKILLVEDNEVNRHLVTAFLSKRGYNVESAEDGEIASRMVRDKAYDLILMDVHLPKRDGFEVTRDIRGGKLGSRNTKAPVVALTASAIKGERERCLGAGMNDFITKPVDLDMLEQVVRRFVATGSKVVALPATSTKPEAKGERPRPETLKRPEAPLDGPASTEPMPPRQQPLTAAEAMKRAGLSPVSGSSAGPRKAPDLDDDLRAELFQIFKRVTPARLEELRVAVSKSDWKTAGRVAHTMKSSAAQLGFFDLADLCKKLEAKGFEGEAEGWPQELKELERVSGEVMNAALAPT